jgi:hypothetical protein
LLTIVAQHQQQLAQLHACVAELEARLNQHSQNWSKPPSSDPPLAPRPARTAHGWPKGGQPGIPGTNGPIPFPTRWSDRPRVFAFLGFMHPRPISAVPVHELHSR